MEAAEERVKKFVFLVTSIENAEENFDFQTEFYNEGVIMEAVIMHIRALLKNMEKRYFTDFNERN